MPQAQPDGYLALPAGGEGSGVLVIHAWWGLNDTIKTFCDRLAGSGFVAFAPDLYHGKIATTIPDAEALGAALDAKADQAKAEIADAVKFLGQRTGRPNEGLAVIGFSLGAYYALDLSASDPQHIKTVVVFYGTGPADFSKSKAACMGHFAGDDPYEPPENVDELEKELKAAGHPVVFYNYAGCGHWFFEPDRPDAYDARAAGLAWARTLAFLKTEGGTKVDLPAILVSQYLASLEMLKQAIEKCPEDAWNAPGDKNKFWQVAYHALVNTHIYVEESEESFKPWAKHREGYDDFDALPREPYDKGTVLEYLAFCQQHVAERVPQLNFAEGFTWKPFTKLELQIYSIRHIMQHAGELMDRLSGPGIEEIDWVGSGYSLGQK